MKWTKCLWHCNTLGTAVMQCFVLTKHIGSVMSSIRSPLLQGKKKKNSYCSKCNWSVWVKDLEETVEGLHSVAHKSIIFTIMTSIKFVLDSQKIKECKRVREKMFASQLEVHQINLLFIMYLFAIFILPKYYWMKQ